MGEQVGDPIKGSGASEVSGCSDCPAASWLHEDERHVCGFNRNITLPEDADNVLMDAVPSECPLWKGGIVIHLKQLAG